MLNAALTLLALFAISRIYKLWSGLKAVDYVSGIRCAFGTRSIWGFLVPECLGRLFYNPGSNFIWDMKRSDTDIMSVVPWLHGAPVVFISSLELMKQILGHSDGFDKIADDIGTILIGKNIATAQKELWKKYRRVLTPAFSNKLHSLVWKKSMQAFRGMIEAEAWDKKGAVAISDLSDLTKKFTLDIVATCALDLNSTWSDSISAAGAEMPLQKCLKVMVEDAVVRLLTPKWAYILPFKTLKRVDTAFSTIFSFMRAQVALRREKIISEDVTNGEATGLDTIFDNIVKANIGGKFAFDEDEVAGNIFAMLFAGHETTARTLDAVLALLGAYQDEQDRAYEEIIRVAPGGRDPGYEDFESFTHIRKCVQEAMRLYPPGSALFREATQDVQLSVMKRTTGEKSHNVVLKKGTQVVVNVLGIHYSARHFPDPESFKPSRWSDESLRDNPAIAAFGYGPRACLGRKFSLAETTSFLVMLLRDWKVDVDLADGETPRQWQERVMTGQVTSVLGFGPLPIRLSRRNPQ
ncbi:hypothetical protein BOTBODRAFT_113010 [Botryobasidium botryosum FD-172 SS1]|uniref:Cytochrome P450 n=1 Tax=Botryobasidium botryosum (strain FD-172 SS1) TaxID=930990 RepID=A0A067M9Q1_BOTB1|nr:hypothetical protein BOTBODRAFT_113010 [Botryobasidium botryosum FD-172 SS1]